MAGATDVAHDNCHRVRIAIGDDDRGCHVPAVLFSCGPCSNTHAVSVRLPATACMRAGSLYLYNGMRQNSIAAKLAPHAAR